MAPQIDNKLRRLIQPLRALGFVLKGIPRGIRIKFEKGPDVDIYTLKSNPSHIRARIKTQIADETARESMVEAIERQIADSLDSVADLHDFRLTKDSEGVYVYYAHLDMLGEEPPASGPEPSGQRPTDEEDREALEATEALLDKALFEDEEEDEGAPGEGGPGEGGAGEGGPDEGGPDNGGPDTDDISPDAIFIDDASVETFLEEPGDGQEPDAPAEAAAQPEEAGGEAADPESPSDGAESQEIDFSAYMEEMEADPAPAAPPTPQAVVEQLEAVDAKMLRQAMDSLSLPRSSNVRLVLTRLYRSALDPEELSDSVKREAAKIATEEDRETLKMLREMQAVNFLSPLIELLYHQATEDTV